jgi:hypothetical protein
MTQLAPPPALPPWPGTLTPIETSFGTLTHCLHLLLSNARQRACSFKFKAQLLSQNACREWDFGTAAMATIGNPYKRPIGSHLVAKP